LLARSYAWLHVALGLAAKLRNKPKVELVLVDRHDCHQVVTKPPRGASGARASPLYASRRGVPSRVMMHILGHTFGSSSAKGALMAQSMRDALRPLRELPLRAEQIDSLDQAAGVVAKAVERAAPDGSPVNEVLSGTALGHPLHPPLTDVVIGAWTSAVALDWLGGKRGGPAADRLVALGVLSAIPTAAAGLNDWATLSGPDRRLGLVHGTTNVVATGLFGASWLARKAGHRLVGRLLAMAGYGTVSVGAFLGGHLSFRRGAGVDHTAFLEAPEVWTPVADEASVKELEPLLVKTAGVEIVLFREHGSLYALLERCAHQGGPLHEGRIEHGCVVCPWHSSRYRLSDGAALSGPTAHPQPAVQVRVRDSKVEVRRLVQTTGWC
jgi:nitrite reductase/ring-hydroxylating ferredoxin subunit